MNAERKRVVLVGSSLALAGVRAGLEAYPGLEVITLETPPAEAVQILHALSPASVILDLSIVPPEFPFSLLEEQPGLLIGIDPGSDRTWLLSGRQSRELSMRDLVEVIQAHARNTEG